MDYHTTIENSDVVIFALARWDGRYSSPAFSLAKKLAINNRVFYIDNPFTYSDYFKDKFRPQIKKRFNSFLQIKQPFFQQKDLPENLFLVTLPLALPINMLPEGKMYNLLKEVNSTRITKVLNAVIEEFSIRDYILVNCFNPFYGFLNSLSQKPLLKVYYTIDEITQSNYIKKHGPRLEKQVLSEADVTLATSRKLVANCREIAEHVHYFPNAADFRLFNRALTEQFERPAELKGLEDKRIICYTGHIEHRTDYKLLYHLAKAHADKIILMVGPVSGTEVNTSGLADLANVVFTGPKAIDELPAYLQYSHCTIIPYKRNKLTASIYPLKINEYLAAGKAVVATPFSEDIQSFAEVIQLADNEKSFAAEVETAIEAYDGATVERRVAFARQNTWEARADYFRDIVKQHLSAPVK